MTEEQIDRGWFLREFSTLPEETERAYEKRIVQLALKAPEQTVEPLLESILTDPASPDGDAYAAYCTLHTCYRRMRDHSSLMLLERRFAARFQEHPSALHFELLAYVDLGERVDGEHVLEKAQRSVEQMPGNAGAQHLLADLVAHYYEENPELLTGTEAARHLLWLRRGADAVNRAIALDDYPKFHFTRARLLCLQQKYPEALRSIEQAIDKENSAASDYAIRVATYLSQKMKIESISREAKMRESMNTYREELSSKQKAVESEIQEQIGKLSDSTVKNLEFLGLFAGIVSFTIGGVNIVSNASTFSFQGAAGLLIVLLGALLEVFCGFGIILHGWVPEKRSRNLVVLVFGLLMIALGLVLCIRL